MKFIASAYFKILVTYYKIGCWWYRIRIAHFKLVKEELLKKLNEPMSWEK